MKYSFKVTNLGCSSCCNKIEDKLNKNKELKAVVNFMLEKVTIETELEYSVVEEYVNKIIKKHNKKCEVTKI